jgi:hypothetical protein
VVVNVDLAGGFGIDNNSEGRERSQVTSESPFEWRSHEELRPWRIAVADWSGFGCRHT